MAKPPIANDLKKLKKAFARAWSEVKQHSEDAVKVLNDATNTAADAAENEARKLFKREMARATKAYNLWRKTADNLAKRLPKKKKKS